LDTQNLGAWTQSSQQFDPCASSEWTSSWWPKVSAESSIRQLHNIYRTLEILMSIGSTLVLNENRSRPRWL